MIDSGRNFVFRLLGDDASLTAAARRSQKALKDTADTTEGLERANARAAEKAQGLGTALEALKAAGGVAALVGLAGAATSVARNLTEAQINADRLRLLLTGGFGAAQAGQEMAYVRDISQRLGLQLDSTGIAYARFASAARGTSLQGEGARRTFESVARAAAVMGLSTDETTGVMNALQQMMGKGVVSMEELRQQLGDRLPGAMQIAARAMDVTTSELIRMVSNGELLASDFLPRFSQQLDKELAGAAELAAGRMEAAVNRMSNSWEGLKQTVAEGGGSSFIRDEMNGLTDAMTDFTERFRLAQMTGANFAESLAYASVAAVKFSNPLNAISYSAQSLDGRLAEATARLQELDAALLRNPGDVYTSRLRANVQEVADDLQRMKRLLAEDPNQSPAESARYSRSAVGLRVAEEQKAQRLDRLAAVTAKLSGENSDYVKSLRAIQDARDAGDISAERSIELLTALAQANAPKGSTAKAKTAQQLFDERYPAANVGDITRNRAPDFRRMEVEQTERTNEALRQANLRASEEARSEATRAAEQALRQQQRDGEQAMRLQEQLQASTERIQAEALPDAEARGRALISIEQAQLSSRIARLDIAADRRKALEDDVAAYTAARQAELTEALKPEWQRRLDDWQDTQRLINNGFDDIYTGLLDRSEQAWLEFADTGKLSARSLVDFVNAELSRIAFRQYLAPLLSAGASAIGGAVGSLFGVQAHSGGVVGQGGGTPRSIAPMLMLGAPRLHNGGLAGDEVPAILRRGEEVLTAKDPRHRHNGGMTAGVNVYQTNNYNVPAGQTPSDYAAALEANNRRLKAEVSADAVRPGRTLNRAVRAA